MARIAHIAVKVEDIGRTSKLYRDVFGFAHTGTHITPAGAANEHTHTTQHLCDGAIDLALVYYSEDHGEPNALPAEGIDHIGIADSDLAAAAERIKSNGGEVIGAPGVEPMKFRMPGGIIAEVISEGRFTVDHLAKTASKGRQRMLDAGRVPPENDLTATAIDDPAQRGEHAPLIASVALKVNDGEGAARFLKNAFGFKDAVCHGLTDSNSVCVTDGAVIVEIVDLRLAGAKESPSTHHFSIDAGKIRTEQVAATLRKLGCELNNDRDTRTKLFRMPGEAIASGIVSDH